MVFSRYLIYMSIIVIINIILLPYQHYIYKLVAAGRPGFALKQFFSIEKKKKIAVKVLMEEFAIFVNGKF